MNETPKNMANEAKDRQVVDVDGTKLIFENEKVVGMELRPDYQAGGQIPMPHALKIIEFLMQRRMALKAIDEAIEGLQHMMMPSKGDSEFGEFDEFEGVDEFEGEEAIFGTLEDEEPFDPELFEQQSGEKDPE
jgi:hypothetical protein